MGGFRVLGVAIRREPWVFTLSTLGSVLFGALTVADAWVLGWATDHVVLPAFEHRRPPPPVVWSRSSRCSSGSRSCARSASSPGGSGAGVMQYRMQAAYRREVTRQYLRLPMSWHQQHPTGELLSNANSDVEAAWAPIAPLPMAVGTLAMMVIAIAQMLFTDLVMAAGRAAGLPAGDGRQRRLPAAAPRRSSPASRRCAPSCSEIAHESFDGAMVVKTLGREARGDRAVRRQGARPARRGHPRRPDPRRLRPAPRGPAQPRGARRARRRRAGGSTAGWPTRATW